MTLETPPPPPPPSHHQTNAFLVLIRGGWDNTPRSRRLIPEECLKRRQHKLRKEEKKRGITGLEKGSGTSGGGGGWGQPKKLGSDEAVANGNVRSSSKNNIFTDFFFQRIHSFFAFIHVCSSHLLDPQLQPLAPSSPAPSSPAPPLQLSSYISIYTISAVNITNKEAGPGGGANHRRRGQSQEAEPNTGDGANHRRRSQTGDSGSDVTVKL